MDPATRLQLQVRLQLLLHLVTPVFFKKKKQDVHVNMCNDAHLLDKSISLSSSSNICHILATGDLYTWGWGKFFLPFFCLLQMLMYCNAITLTHVLLLSHKFILS